MSPVPTLCAQAWGVLEAEDGNIQLARQLFKCAVKADPSSEPSWLVRCTPATRPCATQLASSSLEADVRQAS